MLETVVEIPERRISHEKFSVNTCDLIQTTRPQYLWIWNGNIILYNHIFTNNTNARKPAKTTLPNEFNITQVDTVARIWNNSYTNSENFFPALSSFRHGWWKRCFIDTPNKILCLQISLHFFRNLLWTQKVTIYVA